MKTTSYQKNKNIKKLMCEKFIHNLPTYLEVAVETKQSYKNIELANAKINAPGWPGNPSPCEVPDHNRDKQSY